MAARETTLHEQAVDALRQAEAQIEALFNATEIKAAEVVADGGGSPEAIAQARRMFQQAQAESREIAEQAIAKINALMAAAGDPAAARHLTAIMHGAINNPRTGVRFSQHVNEGVQGDGVTTSEAAALNLEAGLNAVILPFLDRFERGLEQLDTPHAHDHALHSDTVDLFGTQVKVPGGLYTVVFAVLAVVTALEVLIAESGMPNSIAFPLLAALSLGKAVLVVLYYMHLREDSRIFVWAFGLPLGMASLIILFLLIVDPVAYGG